MIDVTTLFQISNLKHDERSNSISKHNERRRDSFVRSFVRSYAREQIMDGRSIDRSFGGGGISERRVVALCRRSMMSPMGVESPDLKVFLYEHLV